MNALDLIASVEEADVVVLGLSVLIVELNAANRQFQRLQEEHKLSYDPEKHFATAEAIVRARDVLDRMERALLAGVWKGEG